MKKAAILSLISVLGWCGASAGTIVGTVQAKAPKGPNEAGEGGGNYESRRYKFVEKIDYDHLADFVVNIQAGAPAGPVSKVPLAVTTQKDASFEPHVLPIVAGTTVKWPNEDDIYHNVFSISEVKSFDLDYYKKEKVPEIVFDTPGRVDVFCAIHTKMHCIILVLPNPFFAAVDSKGHYVIKEVPAGTYRLRAWHERLPAEIKDVVVPADGEVRVDFSLGFAGLPKS